MEIILGLIVGIVCGLYIINDSKKRNMSGVWSLLGFLLGLIGLLIYIIARKPIATQQNTFQTNQFASSTFQATTENVTIPEFCPHCKNPNTKRIRLCEWCGNQII